MIFYHMANAKTCITVMGTVCWFQARSYRIFARGDEMFLRSVAELRSPSSIAVRARRGLFSFFNYSSIISFIQSKGSIEYNNSGAQLEDIEIYRFPSADRDHLKIA